MNVFNASSHRRRIDWGLRKYAGEQKVDWSDGSHCALGLEPTIEAYVAHIVEIFREVKRVLRKDGICFINLGDTYVAHDANTWEPKAKSVWISESRKSAASAGIAVKKSKIGLPAKNLCMIPARVALALQADGWWVRSDIIWAKKNYMPESCTDRCTKSYDHIFLLTKKAHYYFDSEAIKEKYMAPLNRWGGPEIRKSSHKYIEMGGHDGQQHYGATSMYREGRPVRPQESGKNRRDVWWIPDIWEMTTRGYKEAHFATFPPELPRRCILAGSSPRACPKCKAPWKRIIESSIMGTPRKERGKHYRQTDEDGTQSYLSKTDIHGTRISQTLGWEPTCKCGAGDSGKCLVLDPFCGSGTTLAVAAQLGRDYCGIEIAREYESMINKRLAEPLQGLTARDVEAKQGSLLK
jgi:DNA modification methylase